MLLVQNQILMLKKSYPLDYMAERPKMRVPRDHTASYFRSMMQRRTILKNVTFKRLMEIKQHLNKPSLYSLIDKAKE